MKCCNTTRNSLLIVGLAVAGLSTLSAQASLLAYEGFNYPDPNGTSVSGLNGGTGWTEAYPAPSGTINLQNDISFPGVTSVGKSMQYGANANLTANGRNWTAAVADGTYWYSFLLNPVTDGTAISRGTFGVFQNGSLSDNQNGFGIRLDGSPTTLNINAQAPNQAGGANIALTYNQTYFVLGRVSVNLAGSTVNSLWVYSPSDTLPTSVPVTAMSSSSQAVTSINGAMYGRAFGNSLPIGYDEIRIGTDFADVVPVPEPTSAVLVLLGLGLGARTLRRR